MSRYPPRFITNSFDNAGSLRGGLAIGRELWNMTLPERENCPPGQTGDEHKPACVTAAENQDTWPATVNQERPASMRRDEENSTLVAGPITDLWKSML